LLNIPFNIPHRLFGPIVAVLAWMVAADAHAASCASDGVPRPTALLERFIPAECDTCWTDARTPVPAATERSRTAVLDWIVPSPLGDEAALSAAARRDSFYRLQDRQQPTPTEAATASLRHAVPAAQVAAPARLRVAQGPAMSDYIGVSIDFTPSRALAAQGPFVLWLALVEQLPAGIEGSPVPRQLVRNSQRHEFAPRATPLRFADTRSFQIPQGAKPERLAVLGWVHDAQGRVVAMAQSRCAVSR
jgi:hypothetical protein